MNIYVDFSLRLFVAGLMGVLIGLEREYRAKEAGYRTHFLVALGNASADECADYCIVMFSDLTRKVTMQNLFHDGGFSSVGMVPL